MDIEQPIALDKTRGANYVQRNQIKQLVAEEYTAEEISDIVRVELQCVQNFVDMFKGESEPKKEKKSSKK